MNEAKGYWIQLVGGPQDGYTVLVDKRIMEHGQLLIFPPVKLDLNNIWMKGNEKITKNKICVYMRPREIWNIFHFEFNGFI